MNTSSLRVNERREGQQGHGEGQLDKKEKVRSKDLPRTEVNADVLLIHVIIMITNGAMRNGRMEKDLNPPQCVS